MENNHDNTQQPTGNGAQMNELMHRLQKEDARNLRIFKNFRGIFAVFIVFYTLFFIVNPMKELKLPERVTGVCYVLAFVVFAWVFRKHYKEYSTIDYALPVTEMLEKAVKRYALQHRKSLILIIPLLLIDCGITITFYRHLDVFSPLQRIGLVQVVYIPTLILSYLIGVWIWYKRQKPIRDKALRLLEELKSFM